MRQERPPSPRAPCPLFCPINAALSAPAEYRRSLSLFPPSSNRNPLDDVAGDFPVAPVVEAGGPRVRMAGKALHVFEGHALFEQIGDRGHPERMRREVRRQASVPETPLHQPAHVYNIHTALRQPPRPAKRGPEEGSVLRCIAEPRRLYIFKERLFEIVAYRDLPRFAALLLEVEHPLIAGIVKIAAPETGDGARPGGRIDQNGDDRAVAQTDKRRSPDRSEQFPGAFHPDLGCLAFDDLIRLC